MMKSKSAFPLYLLLSLSVLSLVISLNFFLSLIHVLKVNLKSYAPDVLNSPGNLFSFGDEYIQRWRDSFNERALEYYQSVMIPHEDFFLYFFAFGMTGLFLVWGMRFLNGSVMRVFGLILICLLPAAIAYVDFAENQMLVQYLTSENSESIDINHIRTLTRVKFIGFGLIAIILAMLFISSLRRIFSRRTTRQR